MTDTKPYPMPFPYWVVGIGGFIANAFCWVYLGHRWWSMLSAGFCLGLGIWSYWIWLKSRKTVREIRESDERLDALLREWPE